jgi:hypothetical protein
MKWTSSFVIAAAALCSLHCLPGESPDGGLPSDGGPTGTWPPGDPGCAPFLAACGQSSCSVDLGSDPRNCGACGHVCTALIDGRGWCDQGLCRGGETVTQNASSFVLDGDFIWFTDHEGLKRVPKTGGTPVMMRAPRMTTTSSEVDIDLATADDHHLYLSISASSRTLIHRWPKDGGAESIIGELRPIVGPGGLYLAQEQRSVNYKMRRLFKEGSSDNLEFAESLADPALLRSYRAFAAHPSVSQLYYVLGPLGDFPNPQSTQLFSLDPASKTSTMLAERSSIGPPHLADDGALYYPSQLPVFPDRSPEVELVQQVPMQRSLQLGNGVIGAVTTDSSQLYFAHYRYDGGVLQQLTLGRVDRSGFASPEPLLTGLLSTEGVDDFQVDEHSIYWLASHPTRRVSPLRRASKFPGFDPSCAQACGEAVCRAGACVCFGDRARSCDGACRELGHDPYNCGACGKACGPKQVCVEGECACIDRCGSTCVDFLTDPMNCGRCGNACAVGGCQQGVCPPQPFLPCAEPTNSLAADDSAVYAMCGFQILGRAHRGQAAEMNLGGTMDRFPNGIAIDETSLYTWDERRTSTNARYSRLIRQPLDGGAQVLLYETPAPAHGSVGVSGGWLYTSVGQQLARASPDGGAPVPLNVPWPYSFFSTPSGLYYGTGGSIWRVPVGGTTATFVIDAGAVAVELHEGVLNWIDSQNDVWTRPPDGGTVSQLGKLGASRCAANPQLVGDAAYFYFVDQDMQLVRVRRDGTGPRQLLARNLRNSCFVVGGGYAYFTVGNAVQRTSVSP